HRIVRKVSLELRLVGSDIFDSDGEVVTPDGDDAVHHQERVAMRNGAQDTRNVDRFKRAANFVHFLRPRRDRWVRRPSPPPLLAVEAGAPVGAPTVPAERPLASTALAAWPESRHSARPRAHCVTRLRWRRSARPPRS